jgi:RNA polymerase sigma-70 factor (ECF subfamily)
MTLVSAEPSDAALMSEVQAGSRQALGELYTRLERPAYRTAVAICHDRDWAQDAVQDAFLSIWLSRSTYRAERGAVAQWAMSIVRHRAIHLTRRRSIARTLEDGRTRLEEQTDDVDVPGNLVARADAERVKLLLARLPRAQQQVIRLAFFSDLTHLEIARRLALPPGTVKGRMRLGLSKLRVGLEESGLEASDPSARGRTNADAGQKRRECRAPRD